MTGRYPCLIVVAMAVAALCVPVDAQRETTAADVRLQVEPGDAERHALAIVLAISVPPCFPGSSFTVLSRSGAGSAPRRPTPSW